MPSNEVPLDMDAIPDLSILRDPTLLANKARLFHLLLERHTMVPPPTLENPLLSLPTMAVPARFRLSVVIFAVVTVAFRRMDQREMEPERTIKCVGLSVMVFAPCVAVTHTSSLAYMQNREIANLMNKVVELEAQLEVALGKRKRGASLDNEENDGSTGTPP